MILPALDACAVAEAEAAPGTHPPQGLTPAKAHAPPEGLLSGRKSQLS